ncbi:adenosylcobinamide-phosphate synthase CbiB [Halomonas sp. GD1P12]|uniref:adenosylcobinamide-phosphate synthase CbiB n=1 Tax=Halomonas sp. GD1P12 TaxID=2982691 RepID=UPI0021E3D5BD|nr:adenosylcobinamide-phosphate synthase CbiB [Halomonas sp. GD1P12]UYG01232.1 adenosylcobinamide-phosphate synthase CbiB [Halomonas sp. GD1P12]
MGVTLILLAVAIDLVVGDPRGLPHPVVGMGRMITVLEARLNRGGRYARRLKGALLTLLVVAGTFWLATLLLNWLSMVHPWLKVAAELWLLATTLAIKGLADAGRAIAAPLARGDFEAAREALSRVVGRDTATLNEPEIARGAVETVAENTVDGITSPLFFALIGGAPLALAYKAVNTLDSMVGYKNARFADFGYVSAKLDDVANWLPARLTAVCLWAAGALWNSLGREPLAVAGAFTHTRRQAPRHPSPNAGWPEAMVAWLLGVKLGGVNVYGGELSHRATLGPGRVALTARHIDITIGLMHGAWGLFLLMMIALGTAGEAV